MTRLIALALVCVITPSTAVALESTRAAYTDEKTRTLTARDQPFRERSAEHGVDDTPLTLNKP